MQMKVLMCPVILGCVVPWRPRNFSEETGQDCWGVGQCPEGILVESFSQNAMWPSLPHGAVGILRVCGIADSTRLSDGHGHERRDGCLWWLAVFLAVFCTWREGPPMARHALSFTHCLIQTTLYLEFQSHSWHWKTKRTHLRIHLIGHLAHDLHQQVEFEVWNWAFMPTRRGGP